MCKSEQEPGFRDSWHPEGGRGTFPQFADVPLALQLYFSFLSQCFLHMKAFFLGNKEQPERKANECFWVQCLINHFSKAALRSRQGLWPEAAEKKIPAVPPSLFLIMLVLWKRVTWRLLH